MKKKLKSFFTLKRKANDGFTLVELIVVIAILGILGGVGVPAYSGYVTKANKQADISLASEIEHALTLAHYAGTLNPGASVVVYYGEDGPDVVTSDEMGAANGVNTADSAMKAVFGDGYAASLRLKYGDWAEEMSTLLDAGAMENVEASTFNGDALGYLLDDVQVVVDALGNFLEGENVSDALRQYMKDLGVDPGDSVDASNKNLVSNMATMYVADYIVNPDNIVEGGNFAETWSSNSLTQLIGNLNGDSNVKAGNFSEEVFTGELLAAGAADYARIEALANYVDNQSGGATNYAAQLPREEELSSVSGYTTLLNELKAVENQIMASDFDLYCSYYGITSNGTIPKDGTSVLNENALDNLAGYALSSDGNTQATKDANAFLSYMSGLSESVESLVQDTDMNSDTYFNDGAIQQYVENYMAIGQILAELGCSEGAFVFVYDGITVSCAPLDY